MYRLGLIGYPLQHSFSKKYFTDKFSRLQLTDWEYELYPLQEISELWELMINTPDLIGLNVTIPYKISVIPLLDEVDETAKVAGAVNTIRIVYRNGNQYLTGYNTDVYGFEQSLEPLLRPGDTKALILGTGGAAKAVKYVLDTFGIQSRFVSRTADKGAMTYTDLNKEIIKEHSIIINTTPLGMYPDIQNAPAIPYEAINSGHLLYDLVYNPEITLFLQKGVQAGARVKNGLEMLYLQAEKAWEIWTNTNEK
jgi:shikimate dehydrogenase